MKKMKKNRKKLAQPQSVQRTEPANKELPSWAIITEQEREAARNSLKLLDSPNLPNNT